MYALIDEAANKMFREDVGLGFLDIPKLIEGAMEAHKEDFRVKNVTLDDVLSCDAWAREYFSKNMKNIVNAPVIII